MTSEPIGPPDRTPRQVPDWVLFLGKFVRHGVAIASVSPSSAYLARAVIEGIDWPRTRCVVELGAGTGPITAEILRRAAPGCRVLINERDPDFCARLRERFPGAEIVMADAADLDRLLAEGGIDHIDHVICGLPLPSFSQAACAQVIEAVSRRLVADGTFRQLTALPWVYYPLYRHYFRDVRFRLVVRNLPPAGYYLCRQPLTCRSADRR